ncbi:MAG: tetratricopeptide repeat protein [Betaproteobacteria bacterium]
MSLINQVLKDLDARRPESGEQILLPNEVRSLPVLQKSHWPLVLSVLVVSALALGVAFSPWEEWMPGHAPAAQVLPSAAVPLAVAPIVKPEERPAVAEDKTLPPEDKSSVESITELPPVPPLERSLRLSEVIESPSVNLNKKGSGVIAATRSGGNASAGLPVAAPAPKKLAVEEKLPAAPRELRGAVVERTSSALVLAKAAGKTSAVPSIARTEAAGSPHEQAESEYRKAISAINLGRMAEAMDGLRSALRHDGLHVASRQLLVKLLLEAKRRDEAILCLQEGLQELPAQTGWAMSLARLQMDRGDLSGAWKTLDQSQPAAGNIADYQGFSAHVLHRLGRNQEAAERYALAARLSPGDGRWWLGLGLAHEAEGRGTEAKEAFLRAKQSGNLSSELAAMVEQKLR